MSAKFWIVSKTMQLQRVITRGCGATNFFYREKLYGILVVILAVSFIKKSFQYNFIKILSDRIKNFV